MTWPLVVPKNADEPTATTVFLRFCQTPAANQLFTSFPFRDSISPIMENQIEKNMENEMDIGIINYIGNYRGSSLNS